MEGYRPEQIAYGTGGPPHVENMHTSEPLGAAFADMEILYLADQGSLVAGGSGHHGRSALIDLVARKLQNIGAKPGLYGPPIKNYSLGKSVRWLWS